MYTADHWTRSVQFVELSDTTLYAVSYALRISSCVRCWWPVTQLYRLLFVFTRYKDYVAIRLLVKSKFS